MSKVEVINLARINILKNKEFLIAYIYKNESNWKISINKPLQLPGYVEFPVNELDQLNDIK